MSTTVQISGACGYCGNWHSGTCPRVKSIEYHPDGTVKRIEFHSDAWTHDACGCEKCHPEQGVAGGVSR